MEKNCLALDVSVYKTDAIDTNHPNDIESKCDDMLKVWLQSTTSACWCKFIQALYTVGLNEVANEARAHLQSSHDDNATTLLDGGGSSLRIEEDTLNLHQLFRHLRKIPDNDIHSFVLSLFHQDVALDIIRDIRANGGSKEDNVSRICKAFLNETDRSWTKIYVALKEAECDDLAETIEACFLPIM